MQLVSPTNVHHLEEAQRIAHVGSWERDLATGDLWWSDESCRIMGIEPGTFAGTLEAFMGFIHPDDRHLATPTDTQLTNEATLESEYRIVRPDGSVRVVHETAEIVRDEAGRPIRLIGTCLDITERVDAEHERARLASAVEQTADSIWMQDLDNNVSYVNRAFTRDYGFEPDEIVGRHASMVDSHVHSKAFFDEIWATAAAGKTWSGAIVNRRKDGTTFEVEAVISGIKDVNGRVIGYMQTDRDVTHERALEGALERSARERESIEVALARIDSSAPPEVIASTACTEILRFSGVDTAMVLVLEPEIGWVLAHVGKGTDERPDSARHSPSRGSTTCANAPPAARGSRRWRARPDEYAFMDAIESPPDPQHRLRAVPWPGRHPRPDRDRSTTTRRPPIHSSNACRRWSRSGRSSGP